jgi:hypothetical protein
LPRRVRCREIRPRRHEQPALNDWQAPHHAGLLIAFAHLDVGRIAEAIELADDALARLPDDAPTQEAFAGPTNASRTGRATPACSRVRVEATTAVPAA